MSNPQCRFLDPHTAFARSTIPRRSDTVTTHLGAPPHISQASVSNAHAQGEPQTMTVTTGRIPRHQWDGTALQFQMPDGLWGRRIDLRGPQGLPPEHNWPARGILRFRQPDSSWGPSMNIMGPQGRPGRVPVHQVHDEGHAIRFSVGFDKSGTPEWGDWVRVTGEPGRPPEHRWSVGGGAGSRDDSGKQQRLQFRQPDGSWGEARVVSGARGPRGPPGPEGREGRPGKVPAHKWEGTTLFLQNPDGQWDLGRTFSFEPAHNAWQLAPDGTSLACDLDVLIKGLDVHAELSALRDVVYHRFDAQQSIWISADNSGTTDRFSAKFSAHWPAPMHKGCIPVKYCVRLMSRDGSCLAERRTDETELEFPVVVDGVEVDTMEVVIVPSGSKLTKRVPELVF